MIINSPKTHGRIDMKFDTGVHGAQGMNPTDFGDDDLILTSFLQLHQEVNICGLEWSLSATVWWIAIKIGTYIHQDEF